MDKGSHAGNANILTLPFLAMTIQPQRLSLLFLGLSATLWITTSGAVHLYPSFLLITLSILGWGATLFFPKIPAFDTRIPQTTLLMNALFAVMIGGCLVSILPLPMGLVDWLSPNAAAYYRDMADLLRIPPTTASLSVSRASTAYALWILLGQCALFNFAARSFYRHDSMKHLVHVLMGAAVFLILMLLYERVTGSHGIGQTGSLSHWHLGSMINANHTAAILAATSILALASTVLRRHGNTALSNRIPGLCLWFALSTAMFLQQSRSAVMAWVIAHILLLCFVLTRRTKPRLRQVFLIAATALLLVIGIFFISHDAIEKTMTDISAASLNTDVDDITHATILPHTPKPIEKTGLYGSFARLTQSWAPAGFGRSAFADAYLPFQPFSFPKRFMHAECEAFELMMEYGPIAGGIVLLLLLAALISGVRTLSRFHADRLAPAIVLAIAVFLMQSCFDFGLRYWTCGYPLVLLLGALCGRSDWLRVSEQIEATEQDEATNPPPKRIPRILRMTGNITLAVAILASLPCLSLAVAGLTQNDIERMHTVHTLVAENGHLYALRDHEKIDYGETLQKTWYAHAANALIPKFTAMAIIHGAPQSTDKNAAYARASMWLSATLSRNPRDSDAWLRYAKLSAVQGDDPKAAGALAESLMTDYRAYPPAVVEAALFPASTLQYFAIQTQYTWLLPLMATEFIKKYRFTEALTLAQLSSALLDQDSARQILYETWQAMGFQDGIEQIITSIPSPVTTFSDFKIATSWAIKQRDKANLMSILATAEPALKDIPEYWKLRAFYTAFHAPASPEFGEIMAPLILKMNYYARQFPSWRADAALVEAKTALRKGERNHAANAAKRVLRYQPHSKTAKRILQEVEKL